MEGKEDEEWRGRKKRGEKEREKREEEDEEWRGRKMRSGGEGRKEGRKRERRGKKEDEEWREGRKEGGGGKGRERGEREREKRRLKNKQNNTLSFSLVPFATFQLDNKEVRSYTAYLCSVQQMYYSPSVKKCTHPSSLYHIWSVVTDSP